MTEKTWRDRAIEATRNSQFGAVLCCALGETIPAPCFTSKATITSDGFVMADFTDKNGRGRLGAFVGAADDLAGNARGLATHLGLNDEERGELFATIQGWIATDYSGQFRLVEKRSLN